MAPRRGKKKGVPGWLKAIGVLVCLAVLWAYLFTVRVSAAIGAIEQQEQRVDVSAVLQEVEASPWRAQKWWLQTDTIAASFDLSVGSPPALTGLWLRRAGKADFQLNLQSAAPQLWLFVERGSSQPVTCTVAANRISGAQIGKMLQATLSCEHGNVEWSIALLSTLHGDALRWRLHSGQASEVRLNMRLPSAAVEGTVDGSPVVARRRPHGFLIPAKAEASGSHQGHGPERLVDGDFNTEWFANAGAEDAWVTLDLGAAWILVAISFQWWAVSMADDWTLESKGDQDSAWIQRASGVGGKVKWGNAEHVLGSPPDMNPSVHLKGWEAATRMLRLTMRRGHKDPWGFGVLFGLRSFDARGFDAAGAAGPARLWGGRKDSPGVWMAIEHPRAQCTVVEGTDGNTLKPGQRTSHCKLLLESHAADGMDITGSLGFFEDGHYPQLRRAFAAHLEVARGQRFGQNLHYNSWYDLRSAPCQDGSGMGGASTCTSHLMDKGSCLERLKVFNENLAKRDAPHLDGFLLDDGWDNWDSLWEIDETRFPGGFAPLVETARSWGTKLGVWMSPFGGYMIAGSRRLAYGRSHGFEISPRGSFALSGPKYYSNFKAKVDQRLSEGFGLFKFDGMGGGLGQAGGDAFLADFEAVLHLVRSMKPVEFPPTPEPDVTKSKPWVSLTIGTWPSPFWLLWADSIWRDGPDVGGEGQGSPRERWLTFRDHALRQALDRGPLFPMTALMQHGIVWSRAAEANEIFTSERSNSFIDFCIEVLTFFLSGTGLQELYIQLELMKPQHWDFLAEVAAVARRDAAILSDAHPIGGNPVDGEAYGTAAFQAAGAFSPARGYLWWRNPATNLLTATFSIAQVLELPDGLLRPEGTRSMLCWELRPLHPAAIHPHLTATPEIRLTTKGRDLFDSSPSCPCASQRGATMPKLWGPQELLEVVLAPFAVHAWHLIASPCT